MNDLESQLHDALHSLAEGGRSQSGPALRRRAHRRSVGLRAGGVAAIGAAGVVGAVAAPSLLGQPHQGTGASGTSPTVTTSATVTAKVTRPAKASGTVATQVRPSASSNGTPAKVPQTGWEPAGTLIDDPTILVTAPRVAASDADWVSWAGGPLLEQDSVRVVYADKVHLDTAWPQYPRPLVIVTGHTAADPSTVRIAAMTTIAGGQDANTLTGLTLDAMTTVSDTAAKVIAVSDGQFAYVAAEAGIDSATAYYNVDGVGHTTLMTLMKGVATLELSPEEHTTPPASGSTPATPSALSRPTATVTRIVATSDGKVVWDGAPVKGR